MRPILYSCRALNSVGVEVHVAINAQSEIEAIAELRKQDLFPKKIEVLQDHRYLVGQQRKQARKEGIFFGLIKQKKIPEKELMVFTRQLATLLDAGLPLVRGLIMLEEQQEEGLMKDVLGEVRDAIQSGETLSDALNHHPQIFDHLYVQMVKAGELGGVLDIVLNRMAEFAEKAQKLKGKVKSAMMYPGIVMFIAITIVIGLLIFIVPKFQKIFADMLGGRPLPFLTQMIVDGSNGLVDHWLIIVGCCAALYFLVITLLKKPKVRALVDKGMYWMPVFGKLVRMGAIAQFCRTLGTLMLSGVPILQALNNAKETSSNKVISSAAVLIHTNVKGGESIKLAMAASRAFPMMVVGMVQVGEETGALPKMLLKISELYEEEVDTVVAGLTSLLEPIMIVFLALVIGTVVVALFLPLISIISGIQDMH
jgi:type IV pilus assembly protein PilC